MLLDIDQFKRQVELKDTENDSQVIPYLLYKIALEHDRVMRSNRSNSKTKLNALAQLFAEVKFK